MFKFSKKMPVIVLHGIISSAKNHINIDQMKEHIDDAFDYAVSYKTGEVYLDINSPGGSPTQSEMVANYIRMKADTTKVKVVAFVQDVCASGGYWIATAADEIHANTTSIVGSIGVVSGGFGFVELISKIGVERRLMTAGKSKARNDPFSERSTEDLEFQKEIMEELHQLFITQVSSRRKVDPCVFDARIVLGTEAITLGLTDGNDTMWEYLSRRDGKWDVKRFVKKEKFSLGRMLFGAAQMMIEEDNHLPKTMLKM